HVSSGVPTGANSWHRLDGRDISTGHVLGRKHFVHVDPHGIAFTADFEITLQAATGVDPPFDQSAVLQQFIGGTIWMANDIGAQKKYPPSTRKQVPGDPMATPPVPAKLVPYASSGRVLRGYRPLIRTLATEAPPPDGDYVFIDEDLDGKGTLLRTMAISSIATLDDWADPAKASPVGPTLPAGVDIVQAAGGHANPTFYVGDAAGNVYKLNAAGPNWDPIVPKGPQSSN